VGYRWDFGGDKKVKLCKNFDQTKTAFEGAVSEQEGKDYSNIREFGLLSQAPAPVR